MDVDLTDAGKAAATDAGKCLKARLSNSCF